MRTKKINTIENEMISSIAETKPFPIREVQYIALFPHRTEYSANREAMEQAIAAEREAGNCKNVRVFKVERDIEW